MTEYTENNAFGQRLLKVLEQRGISQKQLADELGCVESAVTAWIRGTGFPSKKYLRPLCTFLKVSLDWLYAFHESENSNITWTETYPNYMSKADIIVVKKGIEAFRLLINDRLPSAEVQSKLGDRETLRSAIKIALNTRSLQITHVQVDENRETLLESYFPGLEAHVANIPNFDTDMIRTEIVSFLAANEVFDELHFQNVGVGAGYTLSRVAQLTTPRQRNGTKWIPLMQVPGETVNHLSANFVANLLATQHPGSSALYFPHMHGNPSDYARRMYNRIKEEMLDMGHIFCTVNGLEKERADVKTRFRTADGETHTSWDAEILLGKNVTSFAMEILGLFLDGQSKPIAIENSVLSEEIYPDMPKDNKEEIIETVKRVAGSGRVWIVATGRYKAPSVLTALQNGLCNGLVIDAEIADYIIAKKQNPEK
ncbi:MAG: helix-turn-helix domain-containing protein [Chloroflexi bacterium]|nr:helix-turn-helix domain-containing protein [Chloroflexota bacterium]